MPELPGWEVRPAALEELPLSAEILQATARLWQARGQAIWPTSMLSVERLRQQAEPSGFRLGWLGAEAAATMLLIDHDPEFWPDAAPGEALYLHKLGVHPRFQGQGLARRMLEAAVLEAGQRRLTFLRLDTAWDRPKLRALYRDFGFTETGRRTVHGRDVALYELRL
ncbi:GNAT family N-acetyltransferase [Deinococcus irradiatisoli]|uniref:GNAT family N-acetyltransferase n=1 Tax=Deinococcus irradiatisoli TaxID=2202254 RepID=A0A2Z3JT52_9DEIO|nr:GNAT family N-acetyltransferase [Deinococcus irradiatisoli]AWN24398.1 GNAT family N-acetyltransferase [Deinococcus irradiatisoli]